MPAANERNDRMPTHKKFYVLDQNGILGVPENVKLGPDGVSPRFREANSTFRAKARSTMGEVYQLLGVRSSWEIPELLTNASLRRERQKRAYDLFGTMYDIPPGYFRIHEIQRYGSIANNVINQIIVQRLTRERGASGFELSSEVESKNDPVDLALMMLDNKWGRNIRFEAKRKLVLMRLAAAVAQRERQSGTEERFNEFINFLDEHVWTQQNARMGTPEREYLLSTHDPDTLRCERTTIVAEKVDPGNFQMVTPFPRRRFTFNNVPVPAYMKLRSKDPESQVRKLLVRDEKNPERAVDDELGLMVVLNSRADISKFKKNLVTQANLSGSAISFEDEEVSLGGYGYEGSSAGSSDKTPMHKFNVRFKGAKIEIILHTNKSYLNYLYEEGVAHDEYEVNRLFKNGVISLLFPTDIYDYDEAELRESALARVRRNLRSHINFRRPDNHDEPLYI